MISDYSALISACRNELHRIRLTWRSPRVEAFCLRATGHQDAHYLEPKHLEILLAKLQQEPTPQKDCHGLASTAAE